MEVVPDPRTFDGPMATIGDDGVRLPERFVARCYGDDFVVALRFEVVDGAAELDEMLVSRLPGRPPITAGTLPGNVPLADIVQEAKRRTAAFVEVDAMWSEGVGVAGWEDNPPVFPRDVFRVPSDRQGAIERAVPKRQRISGTFLRNVVDSYNAALAADDGQDPYEVVGATFGKSAKTAQRWMTLARRRGIAGTSSEGED